MGRIKFINQMFGVRTEWRYVMFDVEFVSSFKSKLVNFMDVPTFTVVKHLSDGKLYLKIPLTTRDNNNALELGEKRLVEIFKESMVEIIPSKLLIQEKR